MKGRKQKCHLEDSLGLEGLDDGGMGQVRKHGSINPPANASEQRIVLLFGFLVEHKVYWYATKFSKAKIDEIKKKTKQNKKSSNKI